MNIVPGSTRRHLHAVPADRAGLTMIELVVVIGIIGVLVALLLPAVQAARGSARRMSCANNARQVGIGLIHHSDVHGALPSGTGSIAGMYPFQGWLAKVLPFIEQRAIADETEQSYVAQRLPFGAVNHYHLATHIRAFSCPEDSRTLNVVLSAKNGILVGPAALLGVNGENHTVSNGVLYYRSAIRLADVTDGLSNTIAFGERPLSPGNDFGWWYAGVGFDGLGTADHTLGLYEIGPSGAPDRAYASICGRNCLACGDLQ